MSTALRALQEHGQSPWIDFITRKFVNEGELASLISDGIAGVTSNPTIFQAAISEGDDYEPQLTRLAGSGRDPYDAFVLIARDDIRAACDLLEPLHRLPGDGIRDGWVSLECDPRLANDAEAMIAEARRLHEVVDRPNLMVKIPGTEAGLTAIEETIAAGIPVNVTLLFSLERHRAAAQAYLRGLRRLSESGGDLGEVASVASFFVSRVDSEADRRLQESGGPDELRGTLAIANAKLAYQSYRSAFAGAEWERLAAAGASPQRCLWASTSVKNPDYRDVRYVEELIGPGTVNTMPPETIEAFEDHGQVQRTVDRDIDEARRTFERFAGAGVDYDDIVATLERQGVERFVESFEELLDRVRSELAGPTPRALTRRSGAARPS